LFVCWRERNQKDAIVNLTSTNRFFYYIFVNLFYEKKNVVSITKCLGNISFLATTMTSIYSKKVVLV